MSESVEALAVRRRAAAVAVVWAVVGALLSAGLPGLFLRLKGGGFEDNEHVAWQVLHILEDRFDSGAADLVVIVDAKGTPGGIDDIEVTTKLVTIVAELERDPLVRSVLSPLDGVALLKSRDGNHGAVVVAMRGSDEDKMPRLPALKKQFEEACGETCAIQIAGLQASNVAVSEVIFEDLVRAEMLALPMTLIALIFVFRGFVPALVPVLIAALSTLCSLGLLSLLSRLMNVSIFAANITTLLAMGLAIDSSLFLVTRYREERRAFDVGVAQQRTKASTGRAVLFSGVVVAASLAGLFAFPQVLITSIGLAGMLTAAVTTTLAVTLTPALLVLADRFLGARGPGAEKDRELDPEAVIASSLLYRLARRVMKQPALVSAVAVVGLLAMAAPFAHFRGTTPDYTVLPPGHPTRVASELLDTAFTKNMLTPHDVLVRFDKPVLSGSEDEIRARLLHLAKISDAMAARDDVNLVLSPLTLAPNVSATTIATELAKAKTRENPDLRRALNAFVDEELYRFSVYPEHGVSHPDCAASVGPLAAAVMAVPATEGVVVIDARIGGVPAVVQALKDRVRERVPLMLLVVGLVMGLTLGVAFRSVIVPIKAIILNALSLTASFGAIVVVFQDGLGADILAFTPTGTSELLLPVMLFALCFGLSMDYEVILLARVREEVVAGHDDGEAVARGLALTGKSIGSAALLFCLVVIAFATSRILSMKALGVGLALAVILDATIVRGILAPAAMVMLGRRNWWPSDPTKERTAPPV
jgi:RND superfamily putative drug exporter